MYLFAVFDAFCQIRIYQMIKDIECKYSLQYTPVVSVNISFIAFFDLVLPEGKNQVIQLEPQKVNGFFFLKAYFTILIPFFGYFLLLCERLKIVDEGFLKISRISSIFYIFLLFEVFKMGSLIFFHIFAISSVVKMGSH